MELSSPGSIDHMKVDIGRESLNCLKPYQKELRVQCHNLNGDNTENSHINDMPTELFSTLKIKETLQHLSEESLIEPYESDTKVPSPQIIKCNDSIHENGSLIENNVFPENNPLNEDKMFDALELNKVSDKDIACAVSATSISSHTEITFEKDPPLQDSNNDSGNDESPRPHPTESAVVTKPSSGSSINLCDVGSNEDIENYQPCNSFCTTEKNCDKHDTKKPMAEDEHSSVPYYTEESSETVKSLFHPNAEGNLRDNGITQSNDLFTAGDKINEDHPSESGDCLNNLNNLEVEKQNLALPTRNTISSSTKGSIDVDNQQFSNESQYNYSSITNTQVKEIISLRPEELESESYDLATEKCISDLPNRERKTLPSISRENSPVPGPSNERHVQSMPPVIPPAQKTYDYLLKVLLVGDSDVGKQEIISDMEDGTTDSPFCSSAGAGFKTTIILIDGKRVKLQLWDTSGQGRFCTIIRSYSRGAQGILLVYDITNKWSFEGINRWLKEVDQHAPGIPKVLVGNRLHLAFKRQVHQEEAEDYAERNSMGFFEVSPLVNFNISETLVELARMALRRNGMERWNGRSNKVSSLYELCAHSIVNRTTVYGIDRLKLPSSVKQNLKSYAVTNYSISQTNKKFLRRPGSSQHSGSFKNRQSGGSPASSICNSLRRVHRNRQHVPLANTPADAANVNCGPSRKSCTIS